MPNFYLLKGAAILFLHVFLTSGSEMTHGGKKYYREVGNLHVLCKISYTRKRLYVF